MNEFNLMSRREKIAWCEERLRRYDEIEADIRRTPHDPYYHQRMRQLDDARRQMDEALRMLRRPSLWQRVNMYVNHEAAKDELRDLERSRRPQRCPACRGSGRVKGAGNWYEDCRSCQLYR